MCVILDSTSCVLSKKETYVGKLKCMWYWLEIPLEFKESCRVWEIFGPIKFSGISTYFTLALWVYQGNPFAHFKKRKEKPHSITVIFFKNFVGYCTIYLVMWGFHGFGLILSSMGGLGPMDVERKGSMYQERGNKMIHPMHESPRLTTIPVLWGHA